MKIIGEFILPALLILLFVTQILVPSIYTKLEFFWLFKGKKIANQKPTEINELEKEVDESISQYQQKKQEVDEIDKKLKSIKEKFVKK